MKTSKFDDLNDAFNVETDIVPAETTKVQKKEVKSNAIKSLVISLLEDYSASTETDIDDEIVKLVKEKLWPVT